MAEIWHGDHQFAVHQHLDPAQAGVFLAIRNRDGGGSGAREGERAFCMRVDDKTLIFGGLVPPGADDVELRYGAAAPVTVRVTRPAWIEILALPQREEDISCDLVWLTYRDQNRSAVAHELLPGPPPASLGRSGPRLGLRRLPSARLKNPAIGVADYGGDGERAPARSSTASTLPRPK